MIAVKLLVSFSLQSGVHRADYSSVHVRGGEFVSDEVESLASEPNLLAAACQEIVDYTQDRRAVLIFATSVAHGRQVVRQFKEQHGIECGFVSGMTPATERDELLARFRGERYDSYVRSRTTQIHVQR